MSYQIEWRKSEPGRWTTLCGPDNRPQNFTDYEAAERYGLESGDERLAYQFRIRPAGPRPDIHAAALGRRGGQVRSELKHAAALINLAKAREARRARRA